MAGRKAIEPKVDMTHQIFDIAQEEMRQELSALKGEIDEIRFESQAAGALQAIETTIAFQEMLKALTLYRIKERKSYKQGGLTWDQFCGSLGFSRRTIDLMLDDIRPVMDTFSAKFADFSGMPFSKIRQLGKQISANLAEIKDDHLVYGEESIPLTGEYHDEIQALIERIGQEAKAVKEEAEAKISAKDKVLKSKEELLNRQERELKKYEKCAAAKGLTPDEAAFLQLLSNKKTSFEGYMLSLDPETVMDNAGDVTPRMRAELISALQSMKMQIIAAYDSAVLNYGSPSLNPEMLSEFEAWEKQQQAESVSIQ